MEDVVITGMGAITPLGDGVEALWQGLVARRTATARIDGQFGLEGPALGAVVPVLPIERVLSPHAAQQQDRFTLLALVAVAEALASAGLEAEELQGGAVYFGTALGGVETLAEGAVRHAAGGRVGPRFVPKVIPNMAAATVAQHFRILGPNLTFTTACAASAHAIGEAFLAVAQGRVPFALAGGSETLFAPVMLAGLDSARALSRRYDDPARACRPFSADRDGMVMGEGAAAVVLEPLARARARGATPLARLIGYGASADGYHPTHPHPQGDGALAAMQAALQVAGLAPTAVDYINAHGTATQAGDDAECEAVARLFGTPPPMSSIKGATGHLMGAGGATELVVTVEALRHGVLPPTVNYQGDGRPGFDFIPEARPAELRVALSNSFGFGGQNACLAVARL